MRFIPVATLVSAFLLLPTLGRVPGPGLFAQTPPEPSVATQAIEDDEAPCATDALPIHSWAYENAEAEWSDVAIRITMRDPFSVYAQSVYEWKSRGQSPMVVLTRVHVDEAWTLLTLTRLAVLAVLHPTPVLFPPVLVDLLAVCLLVAGGRLATLVASH